MAVHKMVAYTALPVLQIVEKYPPTSPLQSNISASQGSGDTRDLFDMHPQCAKWTNVNQSDAVNTPADW